ncbi:MAG: copper amine oxidase N-terminal domain-containing protein, partial [Peptoniphilus harei]|nr:copper amine oxidase N-terminal domain-containing protein [Peptoniphilus harei]
MNNFKNFSATLALSISLIGSVSAAKVKNDIKIEINGKNILSDVSPFIERDRTLVPIRIISENLGYEVGWDNNSRKVTVKNNDKTIELIIGKKDVKINDKVSNIDVPPMIKSERTFVPLRFISESFDNDVLWDNNTRTVKIKKKENKVASIFDDKNSSSIIYSNSVPKVEKEKNKNNNVSNDWYRPQDKYANEETTRIITPFFTQYAENNNYNNLTHVVVPSHNKIDSTKVASANDKTYAKSEHITKFKRERLEHVERILNGLNIDIQNKSTLNYDIYRETYKLNKLQEKLNSTNYGDTPIEKIKYLDDSYNLWLAKYDLDYHTEFRNFSRKYYSQIWDIYRQMKNITEDRQIENFTNQCDKLIKEFNSGDSERSCNMYLYTSLKKRQYIAQKIDLLYLDGADLHRNEIFDLNKKLIFLDSNIMYERKPDTEFTMYPYVKSLLD